jgi:hypothetical protein
MQAPQSNVSPILLLCRFDLPPYLAIRKLGSVDWAKPGTIRQVSSVEVAVEELLKWRKTKKRDRAAKLLAEVLAGLADLDVTKKAFEVAAKEAKVWVEYRGP